MTMQEKTNSSKISPKQYRILHSDDKRDTVVRIPAHRRSFPTVSFRRAVERSIAATRESGNPVAKYDVERRQAYLEYPDGKRTYVE